MSLLFAVICVYLRLIYLKYFFRNSPVHQPYAPVRLLREMRLVGHDDHRLAVLLHQPPENIEHLLCVLAVEIARGLIRENNRGVIRERPGDRHAPTLSAGDLLRQAVSVFFHVQFHQQRAGAPAIPAPL